MRRLIISLVVVTCAALGAALEPTLAGPAECRSNGNGPKVCVQFDNLPNAPEEDADFVVQFTDPANPSIPSIQLLRGRNLQGTLYNWRVWSLDTATADGVGDIGTISSPADYDYQVTLAANGSADRLMLYWSEFIGWVAQVLVVSNLGK